ncbi:MULTISPECIES: Lrp/AsnC family transcriptional regulator [Nguyenibacter]|uniref:Lrp/AsnC family transcriptional regulator n=1 Tax=Nguyenibacter vanlangensis TaxID=1216886 RepID=A0A7Y7IUY7_9PROT|nr:MULTISPECIES: Lrp/AsnC family transcriptional regulator [Nguyenibacter]NVN10617.1 Lrp/AsnC family transcriptional regulator [Nguyenibacter vanlangensis]WRH89539.1 Lrp/AsnC family transcriptional regulator [Nguyenibacter sp. L1]
MLDERDRQILRIHQSDACMPLSELAERVNLSQAACSRRLARLRQDGYIRGSLLLLNQARLNLPTTMMAVIKVANHTKDWPDRFRSAVSDIDEIVEVHRVTGNFDYILKIVLPNVEYYDTIYKNLISRLEIHEISAYISMETIKDRKSLPVTHLPSS